MITTNERFIINMANIKELNKESVAKAFNPTDDETEIIEFLEKRLPILYQTKKNIVGGLDFSEIMKAADREYQPRFLGEVAKDKTHAFVEDESTGLRGASRLTTLDDSENDWRSNMSEPTLLIKIQTALAILIDQNPEASFRATSEKYEKRNDIGKAIFKRNWELNDSLETLKLFVFDLAKYGWAVGHTVPRIIKRNKKILEEIDTENPENNKYRDIEIIDFNDVYREKLDPYRTWIDDKATLSDRFSVNDWYYEKDYLEDDFMREFGDYANADTVKFAPLPKEGGESDDSDGDTKDESTLIEQPMVTVGFYENKAKDLYSIYIPKQKIPLFFSPLPNDDGKLTLWWTYWNIRDPRTIYGIGLYEILKGNKVLYDRLKNMTVDQLVMAIYPMLFYSGPPMSGENKFNIAPNQIIQKNPATSIDQVDIKFDQRGWDGVERISDDMDDATAITKLLEGQVEGKTLGETLHAKDSALKRLNTPLMNIAHAIEQDAYLTLSWSNQIFSIPEIKKFINEDELSKFEIENNKVADNFEFTENKFDEEGKNIGGVEAEFLPELDLGLDEDRDGVLEESPKRRFFQLGRKGNLPLENIKWEGKISIKARSIVSPNPELEKQRKLELFNLILPVVQLMTQFMSAGDIKSALALYKPVNEILEINEEKPQDWLPDDLVLLAENPELASQATKDAEKVKDPLFVNPEEEAQVEKQGGGKPSANTVVPRSEVSNPLRKIIGDLKSNFTKANK